MIELVLIYCLGDSPPSGATAADNSSCIEKRLPMEDFSTPERLHDGCATAGSGVPCRTSEMASFGLALRSGLAKAEIDLTCTSYASWHDRVCPVPRVTPIFFCMEGFARLDQSRTCMNMRGGRPMQRCSGRIRTLGWAAEREVLASSGPAARVAC